MSASTLLSCDDLDVGYGDMTIVNGVSMTVAPGEMLAVVGPNGAGKSTLIKAVSGLLRPRGGRIVLDGTDISVWAPHRSARSGGGVCASGAQRFWRVDGLEEPAPWHPASDADDLACVAVVAFASGGG
ncbi:ATP-binding cassette domain-containing protein [Aestuariibius sp. HNIBRBA575]|uniref:ATP-binding cassette domain-containing protein n=1 Tax=Aestuariibius sp. HNIBRBA575 TaxID=3233343 RepID=UPI0034A41475